MMAGLFLLFAVTMILAWQGKKQVSIGLFLITIILCALWFMHHVTEPLKLNF